MEPGSFRDRLEPWLGALPTPSLDAFDPSDDLHVEQLACALLARFHERDEVEALSLLYELTHDRLVVLGRQVLFKLGLAADPEDLVAAFLTKLFTDVRRPQAPVRHFLAFAYTSMKNDALNQLRSAGRAQKRMLRFQEGLAGPVDPAQAADDREQDDVCQRLGLLLVALVSVCFHQLKERDRRALLLREVGGLSYEQVAAELELPAGQVGSVIRRARQRLARSLAEALAAGGSAA